jgi:alpha-beta hydrolase superfamily lysophospholipase
MRTLPHVLFIPLAVLSLLWLPVSRPLSAADDIQSKRVTFTTFDEVELSGTFYRSAPSAGKKDKDTVVLFLHDFRHNKGGSSQEDGWHQLAGQLQKEGYAVLSFDFRGFGNSKSVSPKFWSYPHNNGGIKGGRKKNPPATIDEKDFNSNYFINLVNDIAAARAFLNVLNDAGEVNSSNIVLIGAGQGATLGALWLVSECKRQKDNQSNNPNLNLIPGMAPQFRSLDEPEGNDVTAAVWLTIYPTLEGKLLGSALIKALVEETKKASKPIPTYFLYAKNDAKASDFLNKNNELKNLIAESSKKRGGVKEKAITGAGELAGSKLLSSRLKTADYILDYLNDVVEARGSRVRKDRQDKNYAFCWSLPWPMPNAQHIVAKLPGEPVTRPIPLNVLGLR